MDKIETTDTATTSHYSDVLKRTGLTEKEAAVYETLLKNGQAGVNELTKEIPYKRGDLYNILYSLRDKGIIEQTIKNKKIQFRPMDPHKLKEYIVEQEQKYREADSLIDTVLPGLSEMFKMTTERPIVRVLEGYDGIKEYTKTLSRSPSRLILFSKRLNLIRRSGAGFVIITSTVGSKPVFPLTLLSQLMKTPIAPTISPTMSKSSEKLGLSAKNYFPLNWKFKSMATK